MAENSKREADQLVAIAEDDLSVSCFKCRKEPDYIDAIPNLKSAANIYHGIKDYNSEKKCRLRLVYCFNNTKSYWEEGGEYDKLAQVELKELNNPADSLDLVTNSNNAYIAAKDYPEAIKTLTRFGLLYIEKSQKDLAEQSMEMAFNNIIKFYHIITMDKDEPTQYIHKAFELYIDILFGNNKIENAINAAQQFCKVIEENEENSDLKKLLYSYLLMCIGYIILDKSDLFTESIEKVKDIQVEKMIDDKNRIIDLIDNLYSDFTQGNLDEQKINRKIKDLAYDFGNNVGKALKRKLVSKNNFGNKDADMNTDVDKGNIVPIDDEEDFK